MSDQPIEQAQDIHPELLLRLGRVATKWGTVESLMGEFLAFLLKGDPGSIYVVTSNVSQATVTDWIRTLAQIRFTNPNTLDGLGKLLTRIDETRAERNAYIHGLWVTDKSQPGTAMVQTIRWERREVVKHELVTSPDLDETVEAIEAIADELLMIGKKLGFLR